MSAREQTRGVGSWTSSTGPASRAACRSDPKTLTLTALQVGGALRAHTCPTRCHPVNPTARYRATISRVEACAVLPDGRERLVACGSEAFVGLGLTRRQAEQAAAAEVQAWFVAKGLWDPATVEGPPPPNIGLVNIPVPGMHTRVRILQSCTRVRACASRSASWRTAAFGQAVLCMHCCMSMLVAGQQPPCAQPATLQSPTVHIFPLSEAGETHRGCVRTPADTHHCFVCGCHRCVCIRFPACQPLLRSQPLQMPLPS